MTQIDESRRTDHVSDELADAGVAPEVDRDATQPRAPFTVTRRLALGAGLAAGAGLVAACGSSSTPATSSSAGSSSAGTTTASSSATSSAATSSSAGPSSSSATPTSSSSAAASSSAAPSSTSAAPAADAIAKTSDIPDGGSLVVDGDKPVALAKMADGTVVAHTAICTHQGCTVGAAAAQLKCPCHGSVFDAMTGAVVKGPNGQGPNSIQPLAEVKVAVQGDSVVLA